MSLVATRVMHTTTTQNPSLKARPNPAAVRKGLADKGIALARLSDANLRELGISREELLGTKAAPASQTVQATHLAPAAPIAKTMQVSRPKAAPKTPAAPRARAPRAPLPTREPPEASLSGWELASHLDPANLIFKVHLDIPTPSNNEVKGMHFATYKKVRERFERQIKAALGGYAPPACQRSAVFVVRHCTNNGLDWDNAIGGLKPLLDCLSRPSKSSPSGQHIIEDDNPRNMLYPPIVAQEACKKGTGSTELFVFRLDDRFQGPARRVAPK